LNFKREVQDHEDEDFGWDCYCRGGFNGGYGWLRLNPGWHQRWLCRGTLNASTCEAYSDSTTPISFAYYGWTIYLRHAGFNSETQRIEIKSFSDELTPAITNTGVIQFPTCSLSGAYYSGITFTDLVRGDGRVFVLEKFTSGLSQEIDVASDGDCNVALDSSVTLIVLESYSTVTSFLNMTVRYFC